MQVYNKNKALFFGQGYPCGTCKFTATGVTVSQWPPTSGSTISFSFSGYFSKQQPQQTLSCIEFDTISSGLSSSSVYIPQAGTYASGQSSTFTFSQTFPQIQQGFNSIQIKLINTSGKVISCWQVDF